MFTMENTDGFTQADLDLMNAAIAVLTSGGMDESNAADVVNNNWAPEGNTVERLTKR